MAVAFLLDLIKESFGMFSNKNRTSPKWLLAIVATISLVFGLGLTSAEAAVAPSVTSVVSGPTTFITKVNLSGIANSLVRVSFKILAKPGATAPAISGTYTAGYLKKQGYLAVGSGTAVIPIYGLYQSYANTVELRVTQGGATTLLPLTVNTEPWANGCNDAYSNHTTLVARDPSVNLGYGYFMMKGWYCGAHPVVMDVDGEVRWAGTAGNGEQGSSFLGNSFYLGDGSTLYKMELDGRYAKIGDYWQYGYHGFHHNIDFGKTGLLLELNRLGDVESDIIEVDKKGTMTASWNMISIFDSAMRAGGDDPTNFVSHSGVDWFHNNAAVYWPKRNEIVVSSRENFVVGIGYKDKKIKWILGDRDKAWYQNYPSLRRYALNLVGSTQPPIGQHAVSITANGNLMLFDNGFQSFAHTPSGSSRGYSVPRQYSINTLGANFSATEVWNFEHGRNVWSPICSSIYQDNGTYLVDYASDAGGIRLMGLDANSNVAFEYQLPSSAIQFGWNALPIHIENLTY